MLCQTYENNKIEKSYCFRLLINLNATLAIECTFYILQMFFSVQDRSAKYGDPCSVSAVCLQQDQEQASQFLQCEQR